MKKTNKTTTTSETALSITRVCRTLYFLALGYCASIIVFDAGNLITRESINQRWALLTMLIAATTVVWLIAARKKQTKLLQYYAVIGLSVSLLALAGVTTYLERGMASTSTILYALPLLVTATLKNRHALLGMSTLAIATYAYAAVRYFNDYFNEGYRIQLWGSILIVAVVIATCSWLLMVLTGLRHDSR